MRKISTDKAPAAIGPYSQAVLAGDFLYASGQIPINPATGNVEAEGITAQAEQSMKNVGAILAAAGADYDKVVKTTCFWRIFRILQRLMRFMRSISHRIRQEAAWQ